MSEVRMRQSETKTLEVAAILAAYGPLTRQDLNSDHKVPQRQVKIGLNDGRALGWVKMTRGGTGPWNFSVTAEGLAALARWESPLWEVSELGDVYAVRRYVDGTWDQVRTLQS
jgi:hypothetical protein